MTNMVVLQAPQTEPTGVNTDGMSCRCQWVNAVLDTARHHVKWYYMFCGQRPLAYFNILAVIINISYIYEGGIG